MAFNKEQKKEYNKQYREKEKEIRDFLDLQVSRDVIGERYRSESLSYADLGKIYYGQNYKEIEEDEDPRKKKLVFPNPSGSDILGLPRSFEEWLQLRDQARKDLFWLGKEVLKKDFITTTHQIVCDQFVQKNFDGIFKAAYTIGDVHKAIDRQERFDELGEPTKEALILDSRGFFKSTIDGVDCIQWMLNVPDIRILILTGEYKLAVAFMKEIKGYLYLAKGQDPENIHLLFPEYVLRGVDGTSKEPFTLNCRKHNQKEPTLWVNSIDSNLSGWHCDVKKGDDVITDENCNTPEAREALKKKFDGTNNLLDGWGFSDNLGTRYFGDPDPDWYGSRLKSVAEGNPLKYFCRACWTVKPEYVEIPLKQLTEDMVILTFPEKSRDAFKDLRKKLLEDEIQFRCQQLNEPAGENKDTGFKISFDEDTLRRHLYQREAAPKVGDIYICWDWALTANKSSDFSAGVAGKIYRREDGQFGLVILEVICDKWTSSELSLQIINFDKKWHPRKTLIEKSTGSEWLLKDLTRLAPMFGVSLDIFWKPPSLQENAKRNRIKGLETLLKDDRLWFVSGSWIDETFFQLNRYTGERKNKGRKDDIPDAMSYFHIFLPSGTPNQKESEEAKALMEAQKTAAKLKANYDRIFGRPPDVPSVLPSEEPADPGRGGMNSIFGGNGLKAYR
jgi:phage terminase large subunit-like protein